MRVAVCDYPGPWEFPPRGYGGAERRLWAAAVGAKRSGAEVFLLGPQWRVRDPAFSRSSIRLEQLDAADPVADLDLDLFIVGHEYSSHERWRAVFDQLGADLAIFQGVPDFRHRPGAFDGRARRLYCHSSEMSALHREHLPIRGLAMGLGLDEDRLGIGSGGRGSDLVWVGRLVPDKAPHIAAMAATRLGRRITFVGPVFDAGYMAQHADVFAASNVDLVGELGGEAKIDAIEHGEVFVYTQSRSYIEAAGMVFSEALRAGTPMAALTWRTGTAAHASLCDETGQIAHLPAAATDDEAADALADAIAACRPLDHRRVREVGRARFDPEQFFDLLARRP